MTSSRRAGTESYVYFSKSEGDIEWRERVKYLPKCVDEIERRVTQTSVTMIINKE